MIACKALGRAPASCRNEVAADARGRCIPMLLLSGPTLPQRLGRGLPTAVIIASSDAAFAERIAHRLNGGGFRALHR